MCYVYASVCVRVCMCVRVYASMCVVCFAYLVVKRTLPVVYVCLCCHISIYVLCAYVCKYVCECKRFVRMCVRVCVCVLCVPLALMC